MQQERVRLKNLQRNILQVMYLVLFLGGAFTFLQLFHRSEEIYLIIIKFNLMKIQQNRTNICVYKKKALNLQRKLVAV